MKIFGISSSPIQAQNFYYFHKKSQCIQQLMMMFHFYQHYYLPYIILLLALLKKEMFSVIESYPKAAGLSSECPESSLKKPTSDN